MKNIAYFACECGQIHHSVPNTAEFVEAAGTPAVRWNCKKCGIELTFGAELVEFDEVMGILERAKFRCSMHTLEQLNARTAKRAA